MQRYILILTLLLTALLASAQQEIPTHMLEMGHNARVIFPIDADKPEHKVRLDTRHPVPVTVESTSYTYMKQETEFYSATILQHISTNSAVPATLRTDKKSLLQAMAVESERARGCHDLISPIYSVDPDTQVASLYWACEGKNDRMPSFNTIETMNVWAHDSRILWVMHFVAYDRARERPNPQTETAAKMFSSGELR